MPRSWGAGFTTTASLVASAFATRKPFEGESGYDQLRSLFPIPALTMHWIVRADAGVTSFADLAGKTFLAGGKGSFGERRPRDVFDALGIGEDVSCVVDEGAAGRGRVSVRV